MKALILKELHGRLLLENTKTPEIKNASEVLVKLKAAAFNRRDFWIKVGMYPGIVLPAILGSDGSGIADGQAVIINPNVDWGDNPAIPQKTYRIRGLEHQGTFAEYCVLPKDRLVPKPAHLSFEEAAAIPLGGLTAFRALFNKGELQATDKVLITGIGGGVALMALQFAIANGNEVYVSSGSDEKIEKAIKIGAIAGANYKEKDWAKKLKKVSGGFDVIIDSGGGEGFTKLISLAKIGGRIAVYGATAGYWQNVNAPQLFLKQLTIAGSTMGNDQEFVDMVAFVNQHKIVPIIDQVFPLSEGTEALNRMERSVQFGKIILRI